MSEEAVQIAEKRREVKGKGEKERYTHLNAEFQRTARRNKKAFLSDQCKEIKENNRIRKTRDLFKKIRDTKGNFHANMGTIKDRNGMVLLEAEDIKSWQEYTEGLYKKDLQRWSQDGGKIGQGDHFLPHRFIKRTLEHCVNSIKQLLNAGRGHQAPRKAAHCLRKEMEKS